MEISVMDGLTFFATLVFYAGMYVMQIRHMQRRIDNLEKHNEEQDRRLNRQDIVVENINVNIEYIKMQLDEINKRGIGTC